MNQYIITEEELSNMIFGEIKGRCADGLRQFTADKIRSRPYQSEWDPVPVDEHYRNALSLCDNLLVHLEDNDITYLQIKKTVALVKKELQKFRQIAGEQP